MLWDNIEWPNIHITAEPMCNRHVGTCSEMHASSPSPSLSLSLNEAGIRRLGVREPSSFPDVLVVKLRTLQR